MLKDDEIVELFWQRCEEAIVEAEDKYSKYCLSIAFGILQSKEDAEECVNDTFEKLWHAIPPARPAVLRTFIGKITRNLSLNILEKANAEKRGSGQVPLALSELEECVSGFDIDIPDQIEDQAITQAVNKFLSKLKKTQQKVFVRRYFYGSSIAEIANDYNFSEENVKSILFRLRKKLKKVLLKEGITL